MACNHSKHNWDCVCNEDGIEKPIIITDDLITGYNGLLGALPEDDELLAGFNSYIEKYGLEKACEMFPYQEMTLSRYGIYVPNTKNMNDKFTNLYHILRAKRRDEANEASNSRRNSRWGNPNTQQEVAPQAQPQARVMSYEEFLATQQSQTQYIQPHTMSYEEYQASQMQQPVNTNLATNWYVPAYSEEEVPQRRSKEDEAFDNAVKNIKIVGGYTVKDKPEEKTHKVKFSSLVGNNKEAKFHFDHKKIGDLEPDGGLEGYNPTWHPNDPSNYPQEQQQHIGWNGITPSYAPQTSQLWHQLPRTPQFPPQVGLYGNSNTGFSTAPGLVNEDKPEKETFFSLSKMVKDKEQQHPQHFQPTPGWKPNHMILKNAEFPDGIEESHPDFKRVHAQMQFECFGPETAMSHACTPKVHPSMGDENLIDSDEILLHEMTDDEVAQELLEQQFGERQRAFQAAQSAQMHVPTSQPIYAPQLPTGNPYFVNNPHLQAHQAGFNSFSALGIGGNINASSYYNQGMMSFMGPIGRNNRSSNEWMLPTEEEINSGRVPIATIVREEGGPRESVAPFKKRECFDDIQVALVRRHKDENGVEWDEYLSGDESIIKKKPDTNSLDYKEAARIAKQVDQEDEIYALARELARYNTDMADDLLWYRNNTDTTEFLEIKRESQLALMKYRGDDKLSAIKSTVFIAGDKTIIKPGKPTTIAELERIANEELANHKTQADKEREVIDGYKRAASSSPVNVQMQAILKGDSIADIVLRLQSFTDMRLNCGDEEIKLNEARDQRLNKLSPIKITEHNNYLTWKQLMKGAKIYTGKDVSKFDQEFDEWWNKPRIKTPEQKAKEFEKYRDYMTELKIEELNRICNNSIPVEERVNNYRHAILKSWREYDKGVITPDLNLHQCLTKMNYLLTRNIELSIERESNKATRLFNPADYLAEVRKHSAIRNFQDGKGFIPTMDLMDEKIYAQKRQKFIDQIFKKANRGTLA